MDKTPLSKSSGIAYRVGVEFISGVFVGVILGYAVDHVFQTRPWGIVGFVILGTAAGFLNVYKFVTKDQNLPTDKNDVHDQSNVLEQDQGGAKHD